MSWENDWDVAVPDYDYDDSGDSDSWNGYYSEIEGVGYYECGSHVYHNYEHNRELLDELNKQRNTGQFTDVVVDVDGKEFPCHRGVLASTPYFKTMLSSKLTESNSKVIKLHDIDPLCCSLILHFLYTGEITISKDDVQDIFQAAHMLQIDKIIEYCNDFMSSNLRTSNCLGIMNLADMYGLSALKERAKKQAASHFLEVSQSEDFLGLSTDKLLDLLQAKYLEVVNEDDVVHSVIKWLNHDAESRKTVLSSVLQEIHLSYVRVSALTKLESHPLVRESPEWVAKIKSAKAEHLTGDGIRQLGTGEERDKTISRHISDDLAILVGGWKIVRLQGYSDDPPPLIPLQSIICLDPDRPSRQCYHIANVPTVHGYMSVAIAGQYLYVTGGRVHPLIGDHGPHSAASRQAFRYDFPTDTWTRLPDMPRGRAGHQSVIVDEKLILVGWLVNVESTSDQQVTSLFSMDCYDFEEGAWLKPPAAPAIDPSSDFTITACRHKIVLIELKAMEERYRPPCVRITEQRNIVVHASDMRTENWVYTDIFVQVSSENLDILAKAVNGAVHIFLQEDYHINHIDHIVSYHVEKETLSKLDQADENLIGSFLGTQPVSSCEYGSEQKNTAKSLIYYDFDELDEGNQRKPFTFPEVKDLPFPLYGTSFLRTKKTSVDWYCREFKNLTDKENDT